MRLIRRTLLALALLCGAAPVFAVDPPPLFPVSGRLDDVGTTSATEDANAAVRITPKRALHLNLRNQAGTEVGTSSDPIRTDPTGTTNQPVTQATSPWVTSRNWTLSNGTDSIAAVQSGTWNINNISGTISLPTGAATSSLQSAGNSSLASIDAGIPLSLGQDIMANSMPVVLSSNQSAIPVTQSGTWTTGRTWSLSSGADSIAAVQSGTWTVQPGNTANTTAWYVKDDALGSVPGGTAGTKSELAGGVYNSSAPSLTNGQQASLQLTSSGALIVDGSTASGLAMINRTDASTTVTASGNTAALDTSGLFSLNMNFSVTAISGTGAYIQFHTQTSDDGTNWTTYADTARLTATGATRYQGFRQAGRYYRYTWDVAGTSPSVTFNIVSTLKAISVPRKSVRFFYSDLDLQTNGNVSSSFSADDCREVTAAWIRGADGGNNGTVQVETSIDGNTWFSQTGNLAANVSSSNSVAFVDSSWRLYHLIVQAHTSVGTRVLDIQWSCN